MKKEFNYEQALKKYFSAAEIKIIKKNLMEMKLQQIENRKSGNKFIDKPTMLINKLDYYDI